MMNNKLKEMEHKISTLTSEKKALRLRLKDEKKRRTQARSRMENSVKAREILQRVAKSMQDDLEFQLSDLVSTALEQVFPDPYEFKVKFVNRRNTTECDLLFVKKGNEVDPLDAAGLGAVDVASFALRLSFWSLVGGRHVVIMDEPFKFLSVDLQEYCSEMLKNISERLGVQIIMVSHLPRIISKCDKVIEVRMTKKGISKIR